MYHPTTRRLLTHTLNSPGDHMTDWQRILTEQARTLSAEALARHLSSPELSEDARAALEAEAHRRAVARVAS